jgi:hypothetical protein
VVAIKSIGIAGSHLGRNFHCVAAVAVAVAAELGYPSLREKQEEILLKFMEGRDVFGVLPTGLWEEPLLCMPPMP